MGGWGDFAFAVTFAFAAACAFAFAFAFVAFAFAFALFASVLHWFFFLFLRLFRSSRLVSFGRFRFLHCYFLSKVFVSSINEALERKTSKLL